MTFSIPRNIAYPVTIGEYTLKWFITGVRPTLYDDMVSLKGFTIISNHGMDKHSWLDWPRWSYCVQRKYLVRGR